MSYGKKRSSAGRNLSPKQCISFLLSFTIGTSSLPVFSEEAPSQKVEFKLAEPAASVTGKTGPEPLPRHQSLVPVSGEGVRDHRIDRVSPNPNWGRGIHPDSRNVHSRDASPGIREQLNELDGVQPRGRLGKRILKFRRWMLSKRHEMELYLAKNPLPRMNDSNYREYIEKFLKAPNIAIDEKAIAREIKAAPGFAVSQIPTLAVTLGLIGGAIAIQCLATPEFTPIDCENFAAAIYNEPWALTFSMLGYAAAAAPFYRKMGAPANTPFRAWMPRFASGTALGMFAQTAIWNLMTMPEFKSCFGNIASASNRSLGHVFGYEEGYKPDPVACERLVSTLISSDWWQAQVLQWYPDAIHGITAGGLYWAMNNVGRRAFTNTAVAASLRQAAVRPSPKLGGVLGWGVQIGLFMGAFYLVDHLTEVGDFFKNRGLLYGFSAGDEREFARNLSLTQRRLIEGWQKVNQSGWREFTFESKQEPFVFNNPGIPDYLNDQEEKKISLDLQSQLEHYRELNIEWRNASLKGYVELLQAWEDKMKGFRGLISSSYDVYKQVIAKIVRSRHPGIQLVDVPEVKFQSDDEDTQKKGDEALAGPLGPVFINIMGLAHGIGFSLIGEERKMDWARLNIKTFGDYMTASMACGPNIAENSERYGSRSAIAEALSKFFRSDEEHRTLVFGTDGTRVRFFPPRIVQPLGADYDSKKSVCDLELDQNFPVHLFEYQKFFEGTKSWKSSGPDKAVGLHNYINDYIKPELLTVSEGRLVGFDKWWIDNVLIRLDEFEIQFAKEYHKLVWEDLRTGYVKADYQWCDEDMKINIESESGRINPFAKVAGGANCSKKGPKRFAMGPLEGIADEMYLYLDILLSAVRKTPASFDGLRQQQKPNAKMDTERNVADYERKLERFVTAFEELKLNFSLEDTPDQTRQSIEELSKALGKTFIRRDDQHIGELLEEDSANREGDRLSDYLILGNAEKQKLEKLKELRDLMWDLLFSLMGREKYAELTRLNHLDESRQGEAEGTESGGTEDGNDGDGGSPFFDFYNKALTPHEKLALSIFETIDAQLTEVKSAIRSIHVLDVTSLQQFELEAELRAKLLDEEKKKLQEMTENAHKAQNAATQQETGQKTEGGSEFTRTRRMGH